MRSLAVVPAVLLALAAPAVAGAAAGPWSAPQDLSTPHLFVDAPHVLVGARGVALATWLTQDGTGAAGRSGAAGASRPVGATAFGPERTIVVPRTGADRSTFTGTPVTYGPDRVLIPTQRSVTATGDTVRLGVSTGNTAGYVTAPQTVATQAGLRGPLLATDAAGDAALAWWQDHGVQDDRVWVSLRRHGGHFARPVRLATGRVRSVAVAVSPRGDTLVAWDARGTIHARLRRAGAHTRFGREEVVRSAPAYYATLRAAVTAHGRAYVGWTAQLLTEGGDSGPFTAEVAVRPVGAARFRSAQLMESQTAPGARQAGVDLVLSGEDATFAWAGVFAGHTRIRVAGTDRAARFRGAQDVSQPGGDAVDPALASAVDGRRLVAWTQQDGDSGGRILAALAPAGARDFGAPEVVSDGPESRLPDAVFSPVSGLATVVWSGRPAGSGGPLAAIRTFAQASSRTG